jgi:hypothetical protein
MPGYLRPQTEETEFKPIETYVDPVSKIRVSTPSNLIDTDFEYGLQETRWETVELVNNIPTFFSRPGQTPLSYTSILATQGSDIVQVICATDHNLSVGSPIIVSGLTTNIAEGAFVVSRVVSNLVIEYKAKKTMNFAGVTPGGTVEIKDDTTQIFGGRLYQATQYKLDTLGSIRTDGAEPSILTVDTIYPHGFSIGTKFILSNTVGGKTLRFDSSSLISNNVDTLVATVEANATNSLSGYSKYNFHPYDWKGRISGFFTSSNVDYLASTITIEDHLFVNGDAVMYVGPYEDTLVGGLTNYSLYYVVKIDADTVALSTTAIDEYNTATLVQFTSAGTSNFGPHALFYANRISSVTLSDVVTLSSNLKAEADDPVFVFSTGTGFGAASTYKSTNNHTITNYVKLYVNQGNTVEARETWSNPDNIDVVTNVITVPSTSGFTTGDAVVYYSNSGTIPTGLTNGATYYIRVRSSSTISLHSTSAEAVSDSSQVDITSVGTGTSTIIKQNRTLRLGTAPAGAGILDINNTTINGTTWIVVGAMEDNYDSVYVPSHGFNNDDVILTETSIGEGGPVETDYGRIKVISGDINTTSNTLGSDSLSKVITGTPVYLSAKSQETTFDNNAGVNLSTDIITVVSTTGFTTGDEVIVKHHARPLSFEQALGIDISANTITVPSTENYVSGQEVVYYNGGDTVPDGLSTGSTYYARVVDSTTISLHGSKAGAQGNNNTIDLLSRGSGVGSLKPVNAQPGGLTDGGSYYVRVASGTTFTLHSSSADAVANNNLVNITASGSGSSTITQTNVTLAGGLTNNSRYYMRLVSGTSLTLHPTLADSIANTNTVDITSTGNAVVQLSIIAPTLSGVASINTATEVITISNGDVTNFRAGQSVYFSMDNGATTSPFTSTPSVVPGRNYYIRPITSTTFTLHTTPEKAINNTGSINFTASLTNANVRFTGGFGPISIGQGINYFVERVNADRIRLKATKASSYQSFLPTPYSSGTMTLTRRTATDFADSIYLPQNAVSEGQGLTYSSGINTAIAGLSNASTYYVFTPTENYFRLSTTTTSSTLTIPTQGLATVDTVAFYITSVGHGFSTSSSEPAVYNSTTPIGGLKSGTVYFVKGLDANRFALFYSPVDAGDMVVNSAGEAPVDQRVPLLDTNLGGSGSFKKIPGLINFSSAGTGTHELSVSGTNAIDGIYEIQTVPSDSTFTLNPTSAILSPRTYTFNPMNSIDLNYSIINQTNHQYYTGAPIVYETAGTQIGGLVSGTTYYVIRISQDWFQLAETRDNAEIGREIVLTSLGSGSVHSITSANVAAEFPGGGTVSLTPGTNTISGIGTNFPNLYKIGDVFKVYVPDTRLNNSEFIAQSSGINTTTNVFTTTDTHTFETGLAVKLTSDGTFPGGLTAGQIYYVRVLSTTTFTLHPNPEDASANSNIVDVTSTGSGNLTVNPQYPGTVFSSKITGIRSARALTVEDVIPVIATDDASTPISTAAGVIRSDLAYATSTSLYVKGDGFAIHRPYDGGVELTPSTNPDASMIRQTRKYFRYQSGKGIQVSKAINFNAPTQIDTYTRNGTLATITTRSPHRCTDVLTIRITDAVNGVGDAGANYWNGNFDIVDIIDERTFTINLTGTPGTDRPGGFPQFNPVNWVNCVLRAGLFDDQNGMYWEFDGSKLYCVRRSSTQQMSGTSTVTFNTTRVVGTNTSFASQIAKGQSVVIKGQTYKVVKVESNDIMYIQPAYRGVSKAGVILSKVVDTKIEQADWNIDPCDGTGPSGYDLDLTKIQMAYIDYSWYGAGKIRFGFKDQNGHVKYFHEFIHNNQFTEAYMRAGNLPARYEITSTGVPSYVPSLSHWGTSIIMDGEFQDDKAYLFTAAGDVISYTNNSTQKTAPGIIETTKPYIVLDPDTGTNVSAYRITFDSYTNAVVASIKNNTSIHNSVGANEKLPVNTKSVGVPVRGFGSTAWVYVDQQPSGTDGTTFKIVSSQNQGFDATNSFTIFTVAGGHGMSAGTVHRVRWEADSSVPSTFFYSGSGGRSYTGSRVDNGSTVYIAPYLGSSTQFIASTVAPGTGTFPRTATIANNTRWYTGGSLGSGTQTVIFTNDGATYPYPTAQTYNVGGSADLVPSVIPLVSARLAPSVDNSNTGNLGSKEVVNRMQTILNSVGILTNYDCEIYLILNATLDNTNWTFVNKPSLSQLIKHAKGDSYSGGIILYNFRAAGTGTTTNENTTLSLEELATLGNSILGGDGVFPDGPDVLTVAAVVVEPASVTEAIPLKISARVSWTESQA